MTLDKIISFLQEKSEEFGDCWYWTGSKDTNGRPVMRLPGSRKILAVRRVILEIRDVCMREGDVATTSCNNPLCVNPSHVIRMNRRQLITRAAKTTGYARRPTRNAKIAQSKRKASRFTQEQIDEIRNSPESGRAVARRLGCNQSTIQAIRANEVWKDYSNPFFHLGKK